MAPESIETAQEKLQSMRGSVAQVTQAAEQMERATGGGEATASRSRSRVPA